MAINIKIMLVGFFGVVGLALVLAFMSAGLGQQDMSSIFILFAGLSLVMFFVFGLLGKKR